MDPSIEDPDAVNKRLREESRLMGRLDMPMDKFWISTEEEDEGLPKEIPPGLMAVSSVKEVNELIKSKTPKRSGEEVLGGDTRDDGDEVDEEKRAET